MSDGAADRVLRSAVPVVSTPEQLRKLVDFYLRQDGFAFDVETQGDDRLFPNTNDVAWISLATNGRADVIPMGHRNGELLEYRATLLKSGRDRVAEGKHLRPSDMSRSDKYIRPVFGPPPPQLSRTIVFPYLERLFESDLGKVAHNAKFDVASTQKYLSGEIAGPVWDTSVAETIIDSRLKHQQLKLQACVKRRLGYTMEKGIGEDITQHSFNEVAKYSLLDAKMTWLLWRAQRKILDEMEAWPLMRLEMDVQRAIIDMQGTGTRVDRGAMLIFKSEIQDDLDQAKDRAYAAAGRTFNITSNQDKIDVLFGEGKLKPRMFTEKTKQPSTAADHLEMFPRSPLAKALLEVAEYEKLMSTYLTPYLGGTTTRTSAGKTREVEVKSLLINGRVHTSFNQTGTETGRMSCVSGDTLLRTNRGVYRFDEYVPQQGDTVLTHRGRWMSILRKIYKGVDEMYSVQNSAGGKITCTADHRVLTRSGWVRVGDLQVGDIVVHQQEVCERPGEHPQGHREVQGRGQAHAARSGQGDGHHVPQRHAHPQDAFARRGVQGREGAPVLTLEDRQQEPYAGQEWFPAPQLQGVGVGSQGVPHGAGWQGRAHLPAPSSLLGNGVGAHPRGMACPPHRRGPGEQRSGQPRSGYAGRTPGTAQEEARVVSIDPVGPMGVWDIEVGGDHSYAAGGFLNHNSSNPNLQNIPSRGRYGKRIRSLFIADPGHVLVVGDYSQIEPRVIASFSEDPIMLEAYRTGKDLYQEVADPLGVTRAAGKELVLSMAYGVGPDKIAVKIGGVTTAQARQLLRDFEARFPAVPRLKARVIRYARAQRPVPFVTTITGRRRYIPELVYHDRDLRASGERKAFNTLIQGSAADIMKIAIVRAHQMVPDEARLLLTVHDELVIQCPAELADQTKLALTEAMEGVEIPSMKVPLKADVGVGETWADAKS